MYTLVHILTFACVVVFVCFAVFACVAVLVCVAVFVVGARKYLIETLMYAITQPWRDARASAICKHDRERSKCKEYATTHVQASGCSDGARPQRRRTCKECAGASICEHGRRRSTCMECGVGTCKEGGVGSEHGRHAAYQVAKNGRGRLPGHSEKSDVHLEIHVHGNTAPTR